MTNDWSLAKRWPYFALPFLHSCLCGAIALSPGASEGSWHWFLAFYVDFPFSIVLLPLLRRGHPFIVFAIFGALWWYFIGMLLLFSGKHVTAALENRHRKKNEKK